VGIGKTNKFCLIRRCPDLMVMYRTRAGKKWHNEYKKQFPVEVAALIGVLNEGDKEMDDKFQALEILREPMALGEVFAASGIFKDVKTAAQAVVKILAGKELGLTPIEAMNSLYIVNDKIAVLAATIASRIKKSAKYDYKINKLDETECSITFLLVNNGETKELGISVFTIKDAAKAGIVNKDNWKNYPRNMLFARAISNGARWYCPDSLSSFHSVEELEEAPKEEKTISIDAQGEVVENGQA